MKFLNFAFVSLFFIVLLLLLSFGNFSPEAISKIDNRNLTKLELREEQIGKIPRQIDKYIEDRIGFREECINYYTILNDKLFSVMVHPNYTYGQDGYVFFKQKRTPNKKEYLSTYAQFIKRVQKYCNDRGISFVFMLNPNKESIYTEKLPLGYKYEQSNTTYLIDKLEEENINLLNTVSLLKERQIENQVYNIKYDAGHWNDLGCYYATEALVDRLNVERFNGSPIKFSDFAMSQELKTSLPVSYFPIDEIVPKLSLENSKSIIDKTFNSDIKINYQYRHFYRSKNNIDAPKALMFHGSYYNGRDFFLSDSFSEYTAIHNYMNIFYLDYYIQIFKPDVVIFSATEYAIDEPYFPKDLLENTLFQSSFSSNTQAYFESAAKRGAYYISNDGSLIEFNAFLLNSHTVEAAYFDLNGDIYDVRQEITDLDGTRLVLTLAANSELTKSLGENDYISGRYYIKMQDSEGFVTGDIEFAPNFR